MKRLIFVASMLAAALRAQTPAITAVQDGAANTPGITPGGVFVVKGSNLSAPGFEQANPPAYPTTFNNVRITLTALNGGVVVNALIVYTYNQDGVNQLSAVLPSTAATGAYDVRVINGANTSAAFRGNVVARKPGIVTVDGSGTGDVQATLSGALILARRSNTGKILQFDTRPARPGERVDLWGTGLGADIASDTGGTSGDQTAAANVRVLVNGSEVTPLYAGRSQGFPGLDQIVFLLPAGVTPGCTVSVQVQAGGVTGNSATIAVSTTDTCATSGGGGGSGTNPTSQEIDSWVARGNYVTGNIGLTRRTSYGVNATATFTESKSDIIAGQFTRWSGPDLGNFLRNILPAGYPNLAPGVGSCVVYRSGLANPYPNLTNVNLDAGPQWTASGGRGTQPVPRLNNQVVGPIYQTPDSFPNNFLGPGSYTISGPGGTQVGPFTGSITTAPDLVVTNDPQQFRQITRSGGAAVRWTGGDPNTVLTISGASIDLTGSGAGFVCLANVSAGSFTVPGDVLSQLPASSNVGGFLLRGSFNVTGRGTGVRFAAPTGVDILTAVEAWDWAWSTQYQ